jgi:LysR family transcriptional activator of nhaA
MQVVQKKLSQNSASRLDPSFGAAFDSLLNRVNFHHLYYFWVVAKSGSIRRASEQLMLAPPTVSRQIRELESKLNAKLILRTNQNIALTREGEYVHHVCDELFGLARELVDGLASDLHTKPLRLKVGVAGVIPKLLVYKVLEPALHLRDPVQIICMEGAPSKLIADLSNQALDMVLTDSPIGLYSNVRSYCHLIAESPIVACATAEMAERYRSGFPQSLSGAPILLPSANSALRTSLDQHFFENGIEPEVRGEFEDSTVVKVFGEAGLGIFFVPAMIQKEVQRNYRCEVIGQLDNVDSKFYAVAPHRRIRNPATMAVIESARLSMKE